MKEKLEEVQACCCIDVGAIIDGEECHAEVIEIYAQQSDAQARLDRLTAKARQAESASEPCVIEHSFSDVEQGVQLNARFTFSCQAEALIFQMAMNRP